MELSQHQAFDQQVLADEEQVRRFDVVCYVYDSSDPNSFGHVANLRGQHLILSTIPSIFVACKSDLDRVSQRYEVQPDEYCRQFSLPAPLFVSAKDGVLADLFETIIASAINPKTALPAKFAQKYRKQIVAGAAVGGLSLAVLVAGIIVLRCLKK